MVPRVVAQLQGPSDDPTGGSDVGGWIERRSAPEAGIGCCPCPGRRDELKQTGGARVWVLGERVTVAFTSDHR